MLLAGFVERHYQSHGNDEGAVLSLNPGQKIGDVLFRMTRTAVITGHINNENGEPLIGVQIVALQKPTEDEIEDEGGRASQKQELRPVAGSHTDDRGQYRLFGLNPGEYYLRATDQVDPDSSGFPIGSDYWVQQNLGSEYAPVYYPGVGQVGQAEVISVRPGDEVQADVSMRRIKTVEIAGRVIGQDGPAKRAWVAIDAADGDGFGSRYQDTTDEKGTFRLKGIPPGSYLLMVYQRGNENYVYDISARQKLEVAGENIQSLTVTLGSGANFEGRVTVVGPGAVTLDRIRVALVAIDADEESIGHGIVKKDGTFQIKSVSDGSHKIEVWGLERGWYVKSARLGANDILENGLQVEKGVSDGRLEIVVSSACAQLEGSVSDDDKPSTGARVRITPDPETPYNRFRLDRARTDQTGHFSFPCVPPGKYRVVARSPASAGTDSVKSESQSVTVSERDHKMIELQIVRPSREEQNAAP